MMNRSSSRSSVSDDDKLYLARKFGHKTTDPTDPLATLDLTAGPNRHAAAQK